MSIPDHQLPVATPAPPTSQGDQRLPRRRQHRLPAGRVAARDVAAEVGVTARTLLRRVVPRNDAAALEHWTCRLAVEAIPSRGHFMFTFGAERVRAHLAELREACGRAGLSIAEARRRSDARDDGWGGRRRSESPPAGVEPVECALPRDAGQVATASVRAPRRDRPARRT